MSDHPTSRGINRAEIGLLWASAAFGADPAIADGVEPSAAGDLRERLRELDGMDEKRRRDRASLWRQKLTESATPVDDDPADGPSRRMRRFLRGVEETDGESLPPLERLLAKDKPHFDRLVRLAPEPFETRVIELGIFQVAVVLRHRNRRRIARVQRRLGGDLRRLLAEALKRNESVSEVVRARLRDVLVTLSRHFEEWSRRIREIGCYTVASAASPRFPERLDAMARRASEPVGERLRHYFRLCRSSARCDVSRRMRDRIDGFVEWRANLDGEDGDDE